MVKLNYKNSLPIYRHKLANGLDVVVVENRRAPVVCINLTYRVGSKDERPGMTGFAHLFEHLMFEGSANVPKGDFDRLCSAAGGSNNAYTTYDWTAYTMTLPAHQLELGLWLESDRMFNFSVKDNELKTQQSVVTEEIRQTVENQPYGRWREFLAKSAFAAKCSYSWEVHGKIEDVESAKLSNVKAFHKKYYRPDNACLVVCGDIGHKKVFNLVDKYFSETVSPQTNGKDTNQFIQSWKLGAGEVEFSDNVPLAAVFLSYHFDGFLSEGIYPADLLAVITGGGRSSRLYDSLIYKQQVASSAGAYVDKRENASLLTFYAIASKPDITSDKLYGLLVNELNKIKNEGITQAELDKARAQATTQLALELQQSAGIADLTANNTVFFDNPNRIFTLLDKYHDVGKSEVENIAQLVINKSNSIKIYVNPE